VAGNHDLDCGVLMVVWSCFLGIVGGYESVLVQHGWVIGDVNEAHGMSRFRRLSRRTA
jgi:hypothetical protein